MATTAKTIGREWQQITDGTKSVLGVPKWKRTIMYYAVRLFGRGNYGITDVAPGRTDEHS
ncbi:hypothetical protein ACE60T_001376 [Salmonella enterica]